MPNELTKINIEEISLVAEGANQRTVITKSKDGRNEIRVPIHKVDTEKQLVVGEVYIPGEVDTQGDMATAEEIQKAAWGALKNHAVVKTNHEDSAPGAYIAESYIAKAGDPDGYTEGAWVVAIKVDDATLWDSVKKGDYKAFSMGGKAQRTPVEKDTAARKGQKPVKKSIFTWANATADEPEDIIALMQAVMQALGQTTETLAATADTLAKMAKMAEEASDMKKTNGNLDEMKKQIEASLIELQADVKKIGTSLTSGRVSSPTPGHGAPKPPPGVY